MNNNIRVLYKKTGKTPKTKYITDILPIKKLVISGDLELEKFEDCIIVRNSKKKTKNQIPNIVLDFKNITGDFFLIDYDSSKKDFKSLSIDKTIFYTDVLERKSFQYNKYPNLIYKTYTKEKNNYQNNRMEREREYTNHKLNHTTSPLPSDNKVNEMILGFQALILKYLKNSNKN